MGDPDAPALAAWAVVPARLRSERLARKVLADLGGVPMVVRVARRAADSRCFARVVVAAEDDVLAEILARYGVDVVVTGPAPDGTSRVALAAPSDVPVVNVQGDMPFVPDATLAAIVAGLGDGVVTASAPWSGDPDNPARVKVWPDGAFSRVWRPGSRWHQGVYGFGPGQVQRCASLPRSARAAAESLEQWSWIDGGVPVRVVEVAEGSLSVDTPADLERARSWLAIGERAVTSGGC